MLAYKSVSGTKGLKKLVHLTLQFLAFICGLVGLWAAWKFHNDRGIDNFYSLHSWLGLACLFLFAIQVLFCSFSSIIYHNEAIVKPYNNLGEIYNLVGCWICGILVPGRFNKKQSCINAMAHPVWNVHIWPFVGFMHHWYFRESNFSSNPPHNFALFYRSNNGEYFGYLDCFTWRFCYIWRYINI